MTVGVVNRSSVDDHKKRGFAGVQALAILFAMM
jgi:hypothetical protein